MDFKVDKKKSPNLNKYKKDELDYALSFSKEAHKEFGQLIKGIVLFGSAAKKLNKENTSNSDDIDILMILNDVNININKEMMEAYKIICEKIIAKTSKKIHITTLKFSSFWDYVRKVDPVAINILRDGVALIDTGFFDPLQGLLMQGKIRPTFESIWSYFNRAPASINKSRQHLINATTDLYWGVCDSAHAVLMKFGCVPSSPDKLADLMESKLVKKGYCSKRYPEMIRFFYKLQKEIEHRVISDISGADYEKYYSKAQSFVKKMRTIINS
ncbi:MAG: nucleotidyltransferase domain-containing protein [Nanobdellota archaeon]